MNHPRRRYGPSGRIDVGRFLPLAVGTVGIALGVAWLLWLGFERRFYVPVVFPMGGGMVVGGLTLLAVRWGHCRSSGFALLLGLAASATVAPGPYVLAYLADEGGDTEAPLPPSFLGVSGFAMMLIGLALALRDPQLAGNLYLLRRLCARLAARTGLLLRVDDPDVLRVALVPRSAWNEPDVNDRIDHGTFAVRGGTILYEGDRLRIEIPVASLLTVFFEPLVVDQYQTWHFVVLEARSREGRHTLPFVRIAGPLGETLLRSKERRGRVLLDRVMEIFEQP